MLRCLSGDAASYCTACWSGEYPVSPEAIRELQAELFPIRMDSAE